MRDEEIAMQLTMKAMETELIKHGRPEENANDKIEICNQFNRKQVCEFYKELLKVINPAYYEERDKG